jgi:Domain of unknown function (DUF4345)
MSPRTQLAYLSSFITLGLGIAFLVYPLGLVLLTGLDISQPRGLSEVRSTYGAMFGVMGAMMIYGTLRRPRTARYLRFASYLWLGAFAGRLLSMIIDGVWTPVNFGVLALQLVVGVGALLGGLETPKSTIPKAE